MISLFKSFTFFSSCSSGVRPLLPLLTLSLPLLTSLLVFPVIMPSYYYVSYNSCRCYIYNTEKVRQIIAPEKTAFISNILDPRLYVPTIYQHLHTEPNDIRDF